MAGASSSSSSSSSISMFGAVAGILAAIVVLVSSCEAQNDHVTPPRPPRGASCGGVVVQITPCRGYLMGSEPKPPQGCCNGAKNINDKSQSKQDRINACNCIKQALSAVGSYDPNRIPMIPKLCGLSFSLPAITKNTDCSKAVAVGF